MSQRNNFFDYHNFRVQVKLFKWSCIGNTMSQLDVQTLFKNILATIRFAFWIENYSSAIRRKKFLIKIIFMSYTPSSKQYHHKYDYNPGTTGKSNIVITYPF